MKVEDKTFFAIGGSKINNIHNSFLKGSKNNPHYSQAFPLLIVPKSAIQPSTQLLIILPRPLPTKPWAIKQKWPETHFRDPQLGNTLCVT